MRIGYADGKMTANGWMPSIHHEARISWQNARRCVVVAACNAMTVVGTERWQLTVARCHKAVLTIPSIRYRDRPKSV